MIPTIKAHPTKPNTYIDDNGEEWTMRITGADAPIGFGYTDTDGLMHEFVTKPDGEILKERHTPIAVWNRGGAKDEDNG